MNWPAIVVIVSLGLSSGPVVASGAEDLRGWVTYRLPDGCGVRKLFVEQGMTAVSMTMNIDGSADFSITNRAWAVEEGKDYRVKFTFDGSQSVSDAKGVSSPMGNGFHATGDSGFNSQFASSSQLEVEVGDAWLVRLPLEGSGMGMAAVDQCLKRLRENVAASGDGAAQEHGLPTLASVPDPRPTGLSPSQLADARMRAATATIPPELAPGVKIIHDYPNSALRNEQEGDVSMEILVSKDGRATECIITQSSGYAVLDQAACRDVVRFTRFVPARDAKGDQVEGL